MKVSGKCLCGMVKYVATLKDVHVHACHCNMCVRHGGCATMTLATTESAEITTGKDTVTVYKSSEWGDRVFCANCGTHLFANAPAFGFYGVSAGTLEDEHKPSLKLESEIFIDKKPGYYEFAGERKCMTEEEFVAMTSAETGGACDEQASKSE